MYSSYFYNILLRGFVALFQLAGFVLTSTFLDVPELAVYSFYVAILGFSVLFGNLNCYVPLCLRLMQGESTLGEVVGVYLFFVRYYWILAVPVILCFYYLLMPDQSWVVLFLFNCLFFLFNSFIENLLVAIRMPIKSSLLVLMRVSWFVPAALWLFVSGHIHVVNIIVISVFIEFILFAISVFYIFTIFRDSKVVPPGGYFFLRPIIRDGFFYTVIGLLLLTSLYGPRFALEHYHDISVSGVFFILFSLVSIPAVILESGAFSVILPKLVEEGVGRVLRLYFLVVAVCSTVLVFFYFCLYFLLDHVYSFFGKVSAIPSSDLYFVFSSFGLVYFILRSYHHYLYSRGMLSVLFVGYLFGTLLSCLSYGLTIADHGLDGAAYSLVIFVLVTIFFCLSGQVFNYLKRCKI